jgi:hypothetical protein
MLRWRPRRCTETTASDRHLRAIGWHRSRHAAVHRRRLRHGWHAAVCQLYQWGSTSRHVASFGVCLRSHT